MGLTFIDGQITGPTGKTAPVHLLIDSGATYPFTRELQPIRALLASVAG